MKQSLKENQGLPTSLLWTLSIMAGISVANIYYNQPLLNRISRDLGITEFDANLMTVITQIGYATGLLFIIPLGDLIRRRKIVLVSFSVLIVCLLTIASSPNFSVILTASFFTGACSVMPQIFIPIAAQYSTPQTKGRNMGMILSGLLTGILASRVVSGITGEYFGWRFIFYAAACMMAICLFLIIRLLPDIPSSFKGSYKSLMGSLFSLVKQYPMLRINSLRAGLAFGSFLALWSCLAFKMEQAPFFAGNDVVGSLGLCGIAGALTASTIGKYIRRVGIKRFNHIGCLLQATAWFLFFWEGNHYAGLITGIILIDIGMQCIQLSNQTTLFSLCPGASNRLNTIFMTTYFIGGSLGTFLAGTAWQAWGWTGVVGVGLLLTGISWGITLSTSGETPS